MGIRALTDELCNGLKGYCAQLSEVAVPFVGMVEQDPCRAQSLLPTARHKPRPLQGRAGRSWCLAASSENESPKYLQYYHAPFKLSLETDAADNISLAASQADMSHRCAGRGGEEVQSAFPPDINSPIQPK